MKYSTYKQLWVWWLPCVALAKDPSPHKTNVGLPIVNGTVVSSPTIFPYQVLITGSNDGGGTLVSSRWVLTAAHIANSNMQLYAGVVNRNNLPSGQLRSYKQHRHHPSYNANLSNPLHDVALVEVNDAFTFNANVSAVKLASNHNQNLWNIGQTPTVSGFGRTTTNGALSNELRRVDVQITQVDDTNHKIRAGGNKGNDACQGDSGLSFTTSHSGTNGGKGIITLTVNTPSGTFAHHKEVWVGRPGDIAITTDGTFSINGNFTSICRSIGYCMTSRADAVLNINSNSPSIQDIPLPKREKTISTVDAFSYSGWPSFNSFFNTSTVKVSNDRACFGTNNTGSYFLTITASNTCGTNGRSLAVQVNNCGLRIFPNPAKEVVFIEFESPDKIESLPSLIEIVEEKTHQVVRVKDLKALKEKNSTQVVSKVVFEVADLARGTYYVQATFDQNGKEERQTYRLILTD